MLSIVVVVYDMAREAPRTLRSLSPEYQRGVQELDYEVIVVDNGSPEPLGEEKVRSFGDRFRYRYVEGALPSPARAINQAVTEARGTAIGIVIDGARMFSPGVLRYAALALRSFPEPVVSTIGFHLGPTIQQVSVRQGYDIEAEDGLLTSIGWPRNGYDLFAVAVRSVSSWEAPFGPMWESNCIFLRKSLYEALGGMDERFDLPGGGYLNLDFYSRAVTAPSVVPVVLLGEGTFHQMHGGASTAADTEQARAKKAAYAAQYATLRGEEYVPPNVRQEYIGHVPRAFLPFLWDSARRALDPHNAVRTHDDVRSSPEAEQRGGG